MNGFTFIFGGARSGKSAFALSLADSMPEKKRIYVATAKAIDLSPLKTCEDKEMAERIRLHKNARGPEWQTVEEPIDIAPHVRAAGPEAESVTDTESVTDCVVLFDCLTLWLSNLMEAGLSDDAILAKASAFASACKGSSSKIIAVSNEVGLSIVPENALARRFRDLAGMVNRITAKAASEVFFIAAGLPLKLK
ncbi:MAG: bifunctional adenosylcobinamide kinase/adenosylcobinamide-phosphate guanylyltransferase [Deltaproteobacteria bacterium]|nr:bifunctional adenosylcobinamide kinase/adenosylcobinamide-phosphate guanylyltransferase [Deltaproteobacteria bacterium]